MSKVFDVGVPAVSKHLKNIFEENELDKNAVTEKCSLTADDGKKYNTAIYSLDVIIAEKEYEKFRVIQDQKYVSTMDEFYNKYLEESNNE